MKSKKISIEMSSDWIYLQKEKILRRFKAIQQILPQISCFIDTWAFSTKFQMENNGKTSRINVISATNPQKSPLNFQEMTTSTSKTTSKDNSEETKPSNNKS